MLLNTLANLFTPKESNNYRAKALHISSLSVFILLIMVSQIFMTLISRTIPGVLGIVSTITPEELVSQTNQARQENNLPALSLDPTLVQAASLKAADMIAKNYWAHTSPDGKTPWYFFKDAGYQYLYAGENLARDFVDSSSVMKAWLESPTHRDNILSGRFREIGIAIVQGNFQGQETTLVVQMFGTPLGASAPRAGEIPPVAEAQAAEAVAGTAETVKIAALQPQAQEPLPSLSSFELTKALSISLIVLLLSAFVVDSLIVSHKRIVRLSGNGLVHLSFLGVILLILFIIQPGVIL